jgi:hypothetical protein
MPIKGETSHPGERPGDVQVVNLKKKKNFKFVNLPSGTLALLATIGFLSVFI